jgi:Family of unknown function (DUF6508)
VTWSVTGGGSITQAGLYTAVVSTEQIHALVKFLPIFESIKPEDLERAVKSQETTTDSLEIGRYEYHPAVYEFMQACYENGFIQLDIRG